MRSTITARGTALAATTGLLLAAAAAPAHADAPAPAPAPSGTCTAPDPFLGSLGTTTLRVDLASKKGAPGVATLGISQSGAGSSTGNGALHWKNEATGAHGDIPFDGITGTTGGVFRDLATGAGHVTWSVDGVQSGTPAPFVLSLAWLGQSPTSPLSSAPYAPCAGAADIA